VGVAPIGDPRDILLELPVPTADYIGIDTIAC